MKRSRHNNHHTRNRSLSSEKDELKYWRLLWQRARRIDVNLPRKKWCDYWHTHLDWEGRGRRSRLEHRKHIRLLLLAFSRARMELGSQLMPYQVFVCIYPSDPGSDALYVHTPNPQTAFPATFEDYTFTGTCPPLLMGLVDINRCHVGASRSSGETTYVLIPR